MKDFGAAEWRRAHKTLASAKLLAGSDPDSAASRAYYAALHGLRAVFALRERTFTKHTAIRAALHADLVRTGLLPPACGGNYDYLLDARAVADYGGVPPVLAADGAAAIAKAERFLAALGGICPDLPR